MPGGIPDRTHETDDTIQSIEYKYNKSMKKTLFFFCAVAAMAEFASCTKTETPAESGPEIAFSVARYKTKANEEDYKTNHQNVPFGVYSWFKGVSASDNADFMVNQKVTYDATNNRWAPDGTTYYWPKSGSLDFIGYSPYSFSGNTAAPFPTITETSFSYPAWNVNAHQDVDVMYADKVTGLTGATGTQKTYFYNGVPMLFHHALAKVNFQVKAAYTEVTDPVTGTKTKWEITVESIKVNDILTTGSFSLNYNNGVWEKPTTADANGTDRYVWTPDAGPSTTDLTLDLTNVANPLVAGTEYALNSDVFVMPQLLDGTQSVDMVVTIKTYRDINDGNGYQLVLTETSVDIPGVLSSGTLTAWEMNQNVTYSFNFAPSYGTSTGTDSDGDGIPDVMPTVVYFDPAVDEWQNVTVAAGINI